MRYYENHDDYLMIVFYLLLRKNKAKYFHSRSGKNSISHCLMLKSGEDTDKFQGPLCCRQARIRGGDYLT